jgi:chlorophyllide a reductase subunit Y
VQKAKEAATPALYFTNLISSRPLMGAAGAGSLAHLINTAMEGKARFDEMRSFFAGVGEGATAGIWSEQPKLRPEFREAYRRKLDKQAKARKAEELP